MLAGVPAAGRYAGSAAFAPAPRHVYFIDAINGSDSADGTSMKSAWRSLGRASEATLTPGSTLVLRGGQRHKGTLHLDAGDFGSERQPLVISSTGGRAVIEAGAGDGIRVEGSSHVRISGVDAVGAGRKNGSDGAGIRLVRTRNVEIREVKVSGFRLGGVLTAGDAGTRIVRVTAVDNGFAGIAVSGGTEGLPRARDVYIGYCRAENNPGDPKNLDNHSGNGIVVGGVDRVLIEYCVATENGGDMPRDGNGPVGIWAWNADRVIIQKCISYRNRSPGLDGGGFDFDGGVTNSILQHNLSYENEGCGYLLCQYGGAKPWKNNILRHNISYNDGRKNFQSGIGLWLGDSGISDALIHNNTIVNERHAVATIGDLPGFVYRDNIFLAGADILTGNFSKSRFEGNVYWTKGEGAIYRYGNTAFLTLEGWANPAFRERTGEVRGGLFTDPHLRLPVDGNALPTDPIELAKMTSFRPTASSPIKSSGKGCDYRRGSN